MLLAIVLALYGFFALVAPHEDHDHDAMLFDHKENLMEDFDMEWTAGIDDITFKVSDISDKYHSILLF